jgi:3,4-dihydroxy 2-butanone 4-phosphate synthase / GTP cyclohydrolase II
MYTKSTSLEQLFLKVQNILRQGQPIIIIDASREREADFAIAAENCTAKSVNTLLTYGKGLVCVAIGYDRASRIGIKRLESNDKDLHSTPFGMPVGAISVTTGISAEDRAKTIRLLAENDVSIDKLTYPGHVHTLIEHPGGITQRRGHTEAVISLLRLLGFKDCGVLCEILNKHGEVATADELEVVARELNTVIIDVNDIAGIACKNGKVALEKEIPPI